MSFTDNVILECGNCGSESRHDGGYPFHVDCPVCGKRLIVELRKKADPKSRRYEKEVTYVNGCTLKGSYL